MYFRCVVLSFVFVLQSLAFAADPHALLQSSYPALSALYQRYPTHHIQLSTYALQQGFTDPVEVLAISVHELLHIDSAAHQGFNIQGTYYDPYLAPRAWPYLANRDITPHLTPDDITRLGQIHSAYLRRTPTNKLGNVLDEINAYTQTIPFICTNAPARAVPHLQALVGHLTLSNIYLRVLAAHFPDQYQRLAGHRISRGAIETIIANAYITLNACHRQGIVAADPNPVAKAATQAFAALPAPR